MLSRSFRGLDNAFGSWLNSGHSRGSGIALGYGLLSPEVSNK